MRVSCCNVKNLIAADALFICTCNGIDKKIYEIYRRISVKNCVNFFRGVSKLVVRLSGRALFVGLTFPAHLAGMEMRKMKKKLVETRAVAWERSGKALYLFILLHKVLKQSAIEKGKCMRMGKIIK